MSALYDQLASKYQSARNRDFYQDFAKKLAAAIPAEASGEALDLACGSGFATQILLRLLPKFQWQGADQSVEMLQCAQKSLPSLRFHQADAESLPFANASFDLVTCNFGFHWFAPTAWREVRRILKPGGILAATIPLRGNSQKTRGGTVILRELRREGRLTNSKNSGMRSGELLQALQGWNILHHDRINQGEWFLSSTDLLHTLYERGSLHALKGPNATLPTIATNQDGPLEIIWPVVRVVAKTSTISIH